MRRHCDTRPVHLRPAQAKVPAYNTTAAHLRAIQTFYTYAKSRDLNIDDAILGCHFEAILALLDSYAIPEKRRLSGTNDAPLAIEFRCWSSPACL